LETRAATTPLFADKERRRLVPLHRLYGLTVDSPFGLPARIVEEGAADVTVTWGTPHSVPSDPVEGNVLSNVNLGAVSYSTTRVADGYVIRFPGICDAILDQDLRTVELVVDSPDQRPLVELLFAGNVLATILTLRGAPVLHASGVATDNGAVAFIGPPGRGKSTLAALACAAGARMITDDVLRLVPEGTEWRCPPGTGVLRLRSQAESIAGLLKGRVQRTTDERVGVSLELDKQEVPLGALVFPLPSRTASSVEVTRLSESDTLMRLTSFPRLLGWKDPDVLANTFRWNARLAREIPAYEAVVPWGPPFDASIVTDLLNMLEPLHRGAG
jgi:hypothetical protein